MSDHDGTQVGGKGAQAVPGAAASKKTDAEVSETQALLKGLAEQIQSLEKELKSVKKSQQKTKDKRIFELQEQIGSLEDQTARLEKHLGLGKSPAEALVAVQEEIEDAKFRQEFQSVKERVENMPAGNEQISLVEREAVVLKSLGLNPGDPRVLAIQQEASSPEDYVEKLEAAWWDLKSAPVGDTASISPATEGAPPAGEPEIEELVAAYHQELNALREDPQLVGNINAINEVRKKYLEQYPKLVGHI